MTKLLKKGQTCSHDDECKGCCLKDVCDHKSSYGCKKKLKDEKKVVKLPKTKTPKRTIEEIKQEIEKIRKKIVDSKDKKKEEKYIKKIEKLTKKIINLEKPKKPKADKKKKITKKDLQKLCDEKGIKYKSSLKKADLEKLCLTKKSGLPSMGFQKPKLPKRRVKKRKYIKTSVDKFEKPKLPKRRKKTKKTELPKISIKKTKTPSPLSLRTPAPTPELDLSNDLLEFIKGFEAEYPNERNVKEAFQRAVIDDFEEFEDMISDGTIRSQNFLEMKEEDVAPSKVPYKYMSSVREQELIKKLIKYYKESYDVDDSSLESDFESAVNGVQEEEEDKNDVDSDDELEILIKTLKPEIKKIKKDLIKPTKVKVITPKIIKKIPSSKKKTPTLKKKTQKRKNDFEKLLKKIDKLSNTEVDAELKKLKLDSDIDYLKQVILSRLENML